MFSVSVVPGDTSRSIVSVTFVFAMLGPRLHALRDKPDASRALSEIVAAVADGRNLSQHVKAFSLRQVSHVVLQSCVGWDHRPRPKRPLICRRDSGAFAPSSGSRASPEMTESQVVVLEALVVLVVDAEINDRWRSRDA